MIILKKLFPLALVVLLFTACNLMQKIKKELDDGGPPKVLTSTDEKTRLTVPGNWKNDPELHSDAELKASNRLKEMYVIVINESKQDFYPDMTLEEYTSLVRDGMLKNVQSAETTNQEPINISGRSALQYEIKGYADKINVGYIVATVESDEGFHQIITWTLRSYLDKNRPILKNVIQSFRVINTTSAQPGKTNESKSIENRIKDYEQKK
jgi:hypothetical protein